MESALFEGEEVRGVVVGARAFGEDVDGLAVFVHLLGGFVESGDGLGAGFALDEDGFAEGHCGGRERERVSDRNSRGGDLFLCTGFRDFFDLLNQPRMGTYIRLFFAVTLQ